MPIVTVTLHIDPNNSANNKATYSPSKRVTYADSVVFTVQGSTAVFTVNFPDGSPFVSALNNIQVGGATLAAQSTSPEPVAEVAFQDYRFTAIPNASGSAHAAHTGEYDTPGTVAGDLEVVPESGGEDDKKPGGHRR
ncbi:hypothetical protein [Archangium lipolyticum]|uniref:hypothetical protein n=1 Tax=Archangium lipolyticum TaxID=2970465 RepID=UPI00214A07DF|nr:hypothetical protein [Archangium lipolyticum]